MQALGRAHSFRLANIERRANSLGPSETVALSEISILCKQTIQGEGLMMASNQRAAKLDNSYGAFLLPAAVFCVLLDKVRALPREAKTSRPNPALI